MRKKGRFHYILILIKATLELIFLFIRTNLNFLFMGCEQSAQSVVQGAARPRQVGSTPKTKQKKNQVNDMPNDPKSLQYFDHAKNLVQQKKLDQAQKIADEFFYQGFIDQAIEVYQRIISADPDYKSDLEGLGSHNLLTSYYQWNVYEWYDTNRKSGKIKSSPYDALSLCYPLIQKIPKYSTEFKKGIIWYQSMLKKHPNNCGIIMGYANLLSLTKSFDQALRYYDQVIVIRPQFINSYVCKAFIYQLNRINKVKACQIANKIIQIAKQNPYADLILGKNMKDIDQKIKFLKQANIRHPQYPRIINQIGICYGATKNDYDEAINYYKRCLQTAPQYHSCYNNIGVNFQLKENYQEAQKWYLKAMEIMQDYVSPYDNITDVYNTLKYSDNQIEQQMKKEQYAKINKSVFCWQIGTAFYRKKPAQVDRAINWQQKASALDPTNHKIINSLAISYDQKRSTKKAIQMYLKCIQINPQFKQAYYNCGISYKSLNLIDQCQKMYKLAVQIDPKYSYPYNNLGNLYKSEKQQYQQAIQYYRLAVEYNSTYTLALANMGYCFAKIGKYKQAFSAFQKAKQALPYDNNNLSPSNRSFLKGQLDQFQLQGQKWKKTGSISDQQKQNLKNLIEQFQNKFSSISTAQRKIEVSTEKIFNPHILEIIKVINTDKFELEKIEQIFEFIEEIFHEDEQYFHIIPLLVIQKFTTSVFHNKKAITEVQTNLKQLMKKISQKVSKKQNNKPADFVKNIQIKLQQCSPLNKEVNLFNQTSFFGGYQQLYFQINTINIRSKQSFTDFGLLVEQVRKKSNGIPGGISTKIPIKPSQQFKVILRITQKMFKKQLTPQRTASIINKIDQNLKKLTEISLQIVVKQIMNVWNQQITSILQNRKTKNLETQFTISDLLRAKCIYTSLDDLIKAVRVVDSHCKTMQYEILQLDNRLTKPQTLDVVLKIKIKDALCELQLAMKQDQTLFHLDHCIYEILRSPLGCIFGSYLFMSKQIKYPLTANCKDIKDRLESETSDHSPSIKEQDKQIIKQSAEYVLKVLKGQIRPI